MPEAAVSIGTENHGDAVVVTVGGEVDAHTAPAMRSALESAVESAPGNSPRIVADLTNVTFLDSTGLGVFVTTLKRLRERDGDGSLDLVITSPRVLKVFTLTGLDVIIPIHEELGQALAS